MVIDEPRLRRLGLAAVLLALVYAGWGAMDAVRTPLLGVMVSPGFEICRVFTDTAAEAAGFRVGDRLLTVDADPVERSILGQPRARIGDSRIYRVERSGEELAIPVAFERPPAKAVYLRLGTSIVGLFFLLAGFYVLARRSGPLSTGFFVLCLSMGMVLFYPPHVDNAALKFLLEAAEIVMWFTMASAFLYFFLHFPRPKPLVERNPKLIVAFTSFAALAAALVVIEAGLLIFTDLPLSRSVFAALNSLSKLVVVGYVLVGLVTFAHTYWRTRATRGKRYLRITLLGALIGILPVAVYSLIFTVNPYSVLPLEEYIILFTILIPLTAGYSVLRLSAPDSPVAAS